MRIQNYIIILFLVVFSSCEENEVPTINPDNLLIGVWSNGTYNPDDETTTYKRVTNLPEEKYAIVFHEDNTFTERTSGWCGTPPLTFFNVDGSFSLQNDIVSILVNSYPNNYALRIIKVTETELTVKRELTSQEIDHRNLMKMLDEIITLANNKSCNNSNGFAFTGYGSKACGGFKSYITYSTKIDVAAFLEEVEEYTEAEDAYNKKWGVFSTCDITPQPTSVVCENGIPTLKY